MAKRQIEMVWRCSSCEHQNLGRHTLCQRCGNPKDAGEVYEMPGSTAAAPSVTDAELLRIAEGGVNWQCGFCGSHQRRHDGACANCGAAQSDGRDALTRGAPLARTHGGTAPRATPRRLSALAVALLGLLMTCCCCTTIGLIEGDGLPARVDTTTPKTHFMAEVVAREWTREVAIDRYQRVAHEGFAESIPAGALDRQALGSRHHHNEQVPDGFDTEHYTVRVQAGFDTEHYTESVRCGQTCVPRAQECREVCTPNGNGFATCEDRCTGGGEDCSPRFCDESRTRQVPRYVDEPRTRQVPRFRSEPRTAEWYRYVVWEWRADRVARLAGHGSESPRWPDEEALRAAEPMGEGERERERRAETFTVELRTPIRTLTLRPATEGEYGAYVMGARFMARLSAAGAFDVGAPVEPNEH